MWFIHLACNKTPSQIIKPLLQLQLISSKRQSMSTKSGVKRTSKSGGSFVSSGAYACTFSPPLACKNTQLPSFQSNVATANTRSIGKVFVEREAGQQELEVYKIVQMLDPKNTFTVPILKHCTIGELSPEDKVSLCNKNIRQHESVQLVYKHGGEDLWNVAKTTKNSSKLYFELFQKLEPLLRGLQKLNNNGWLHLDIQPENIVYVKNK